MSGLSGSQNETIGSDNIEKVAGTTGLVGYASTYISLQAVNGIFINGIGSGNTPPAELPFSNEADDNHHISGLTNGDFWISGQNGGAVIKSCNRSKPGENGEGIGSIHINSANGDVVVNVLKGNFEANVAANVKNTIKGHITTTTSGTLTSIVGGNQINMTSGAQENINFGDLLNLCGGGQENINLGDLLQLCVGAQENFNIGAIINGHYGPMYDLKSGHLVSSDLEMKEVQAKLVDHKLEISSTNTIIRSMQAHLNDAGIHIFTG